MWTSTRRIERTCDLQGAQTGQTILRISHGVVGAVRVLGKRKGKDLLGGNAARVWKQPPRLA
jgi:hypothetical protein